MRLLKKLANSVGLLVFTWPAGLLLGLALYILRILRKVKLVNSQRFPRWQRKMIVVSNHPSLLEPFLLPPSLFFWQYLLRPFKYAPWSTPDIKNFYRKWYWFWARPRMIPIYRQNLSKESRSIFQIKEILEEDGIVIIFAEGGRTHKGKDFLYSRKGKRIRELRNGVGWLVVQTGASVLPVWVEGTESLLPNHPTKLFDSFNINGRAKIKIGRLLRFKATKTTVSAARVTQQITRSLLELADEEE